MTAARTRLLLAFAVALLLPAPLFAQSGNSTISGLIKDGSGAPIPGVSVMIRHVDTGVAFDAVTNEEGLYRIGALVPGSYRDEPVTPMTVTRGSRRTSDAASAASAANPSSTRIDGPSAARVTMLATAPFAAASPVNS